MAMNLPMLDPTELTQFGKTLGSSRRTTIVGKLKDAAWLHEKPREFYIQTIKAGLRRARKARSQASGISQPAADRNLAVIVGFSPSIVEACWTLGYKTVIALTDECWRREINFETINTLKLKTTVSSWFKT